MLANVATIAAMSIVSPLVVVCREQRVATPCKLVQNGLRVLSYQSISQAAVIHRYARGAAVGATLHRPRRVVCPFFPLLRRRVVVREGCVAGDGEGGGGGGNVRRSAVQLFAQQNAILAIFEFFPRLPRSNTVFVHHVPLRYLLRGRGLRFLVGRRHGPRHVRGPALHQLQRGAQRIQRLPLVFVRALSQGTCHDVPGIVPCPQFVKPGSALLIALDDLADHEVGRCGAFTASPEYAAHTVQRFAVTGVQFHARTGRLAQRGAFGGVLTHGAHAGKYRVDVQRVVTGDKGVNLVV